jgi:two-component system, OmpR family, response regulator BaeR
MPARILIVEDEEKIALLLSDYLKQAHFSPFCLHNGLEAVSWVKEHHPDFIILDLMLPGRDGLEICKEIRIFSKVPIIMLTARMQEIDRVLGLEIGADDYICKPFSPREVIARVKAVLRRTTAPREDIDVNGLSLNEGSYKAIYNNLDLGLTVVEFKLLSILRNNSGRILSRDQLMEKIYPDERVVSDRTIDSHIKNLRKKISLASPNKEIVHSVYGIGYKFATDGDRQQ